MQAIARKNQADCGRDQIRVCEDWKKLLMSTATGTEKQAPSIAVPVTAGNLRNGHVYLREFLWFFPKTAIRGTGTERCDVTPCILELPGLGTIETEIDADKAIFRWRGWKKFFKLQKVAEGDSILITRLARDRFTVNVERAFLDGILMVQNAPGGISKERIDIRTRTSPRCNDLSGEEWLRYSISVWPDIRKTPEETSLKHPAMFPVMLCERLLMMFLRRRGKHRVLDPFMGSGSTLLAARGLGKIGIGIELSSEYINMARTRLEEPTLFESSAPEYFIYQGDARKTLELVKPNTIDICITSPPYWNILNQKRTADSKEIRNYGNLDRDLSLLDDYEEFLGQLAIVFGQVHQALKPGAYCAVVVMDLRKKDRFYPFHNDLAERIRSVGFIYDDMIIWDRSREYNNLRPLGYPSVFRINKVHEFILIFKKPGARQHEREGQASESRLR